MMIYRFLPAFNNPGFSATDSKVIYQRFVGLFVTFLKVLFLNWFLPCTSCSRKTTRAMFSWQKLLNALAASNKPPEAKTALIRGVFLV